MLLSSDLNELLWHNSPPSAQEMAAWFPDTLDDALENDMCTHFWHSTIAADDAAPQHEGPPTSTLPPLPVGSVDSSWAGDICSTFQVKVPARTPGTMPSSPPWKLQDLLLGGGNGGGQETGTYYSHQQSQSQSCNCVVSATRQHNMAPADTDSRDGEQCVGRKRGAATRTENEGHKQQTTKRRYKGVTRNKYGRYEARITDKNYSGYINVSLGCYGTEDEAAKAYDLAALKYRGHTINFPLENYRDEIEKMKLMEKGEYVLYLRRKNKRSKYTGVIGNKYGRYEAYIVDKNYSGNIKVFLGSYGTEDEAAKAYDLAALKYRGHTINFPVENYRDEIEKMKLMEKGEYVLYLRREIKRSKKQPKRSKHWYKGIQKNGSKYRAIFREKDKEVYIGCYDIEDEAARAYDLVALKYFGPHATINFPVENYRDEIKEMNTMEREEYVAYLKRKNSGFCRGTSIYRGVATPVTFQEDDDLAQVLEDMLSAEAKEPTEESAAVPEIEGDDFFNFSEDGDSVHGIVLPSPDVSSPGNSMREHGHGSGDRRRRRTKFTEEQKERLERFAERLGWRMPKFEGSRAPGADEVGCFCREIGITRQVFRSWRYNHKGGSMSAATGR